jgi:membrane-associated protease RseP (regulator of RpoE activity)
MADPHTAEGGRTMSDTYIKFRNEVLAGGSSDEPGEQPSAGGLQGWLMLAGIVALLVLLGFYSKWALIFVIGLLVSIFLHELGHFVTARLTGMKVTQFFLFMGPRLFSFRRGETEYGIRLLPVGAFVRIIGMNNLDDVDPGDEVRAYRSKSYPRRLLVITAGSIMHMLIAVALLFGVYAVNGQRESTGRVGLAAISEGLPADLAGLKAGDIFLSIDGIAPHSAAELTSLIRSHSPGDVVDVVVSRDGQQIARQVTLGTNPADPLSGTGYLGISSSGEVVWNQGSVLSAAKHSVTDLGRAAWDSVGGVVKVLNPVNIYNHVTGADNNPNTQPTTVVGITRLSATIGDEAGLSGILLTLAGVNVFVGLLNLFPLLPFDGGHAAIATYERLRSRRGRTPYRADVGKMIPVTMAMMTLLAFLVFAGLYLDQVRPPR